MVRFVILEHCLVDGRHWDLMLQQPYSLLRTWALEYCPPGPGWQSALELAPHRERYLTYRGSLSSVAGWVKGWDRGVYQLLTSQTSVVRVLLRGERLHGVFELVRSGGQSRDWRYRFGV